jgi:hypothetical protein
LGGGFPMTPILAEVRALGKETLGPPRAEASRMDSLRKLWSDAGPEAVEIRKITVQRTFADFDDFWTSVRPPAPFARPLKRCRAAKRKP